MGISPFTAVSSSLVADGIGLFWTRYRDPVDPAAPSGLTLQLSRDPGFAQIERQVLTSTRPDADFTAKVTVPDLPAGSRWFYRFITNQGGTTSPVGRLRVAPALSDNAPLSFGIGGCANGAYAPYPFLDWSGPANPGLDFFLMLGDGAYGNKIAYPAYAGGLSPAVANPLDPKGPGYLQTLQDFYEKYRLNLAATGPASEGFDSLASLYGAQGVYALFDNHDLEGDSFLEAGGAPRELINLALANAGDSQSPWGTLFEAEGTSAPEFFAASAYFEQQGVPAAYVNQSPEFQALIKGWRDYLPVVDPQPDQEKDGVYLSRYYGARQWGRNAILLNLDDRSYRDVKILDTAGDDDTSAGALKADSPQRTILGATQLAWLKQQLLDAKAAGTLWKFIAISSPIDAIGKPGVDGEIAAGQASVDAKSWWGNYRWERNELLRFIVDHDIRNVVFLTSDDHEFRVNEVVYSPDPDQLTSGLIAAPGVFTVVGSPLGAARPYGLIGRDLQGRQLSGSHFSSPLLLSDRKQQNFYPYERGFQGLASAYAATLRQQGLDPVGLAADFPGLLSLERSTELFDDRPAYTADVSNPQPWDWWSPQTFNWVRLDLAEDGRLSVRARGIPAYDRETAFDRGPLPAGEIMNFTVAPSVRWHTTLSLASAGLRFAADGSLTIQRLDHSGALASFGLRRGAEDRLLLRDCRGGEAGSLSTGQVFQRDPLTNWRSTEGLAAGDAAWTGGTGLSGGIWQPLCWVDGQERPLESLTMEANRAVARFSGGLAVQYAVESTGRAGSDSARTRPLVHVQRLGSYDNALAFYEVDPVTGGVGGLVPGQDGYLQAALAEAVSGDRLLESADLPAYGQESDLNDLRLRPDRAYGLLLLVNGRRDQMVSSFAAANPDSAPHVLSLGTDNRGLVFGLEDMPAGGPLSDHDYNDLIVHVSSAVLVAA